MSSPTERMQVLYEISLSVGVGRDLSEVAQTALSTYLQKLNCAAGAVFEQRCDGECVNYETVTIIPSQAAVGDGFRAAMAHLSDSQTENAALDLPITGTPADGVTYYLLSLPEFGVLLLVSRGQPLDGETVAALRPLNEKFATACLTERYQTQIREERDRFEAVFSTIGEPLVIVSPDDGEFRIQRLNPAFEATFGYDETAVVGRDLVSLLPAPSDCDGRLSAVLTGDGGRDSTVELRRETADGMGEFLLQSAPIDAAGDSAKQLLLFVDVTGERRRQRRLEKLNDVTRVLSRILRHNIRNDLTVIQTTADQIQREADGEVAANAARIIETSEQLSSTAEKAREIRAVVSTDEPQDSVLLNAAIANAVNKVRLNYADAAISVESTVTEITVHPSITVAIRQLVENGVEHSAGSTDDRPRVQISTHRQPDAVGIDVHDNGPGIPESEVQMLDRTSETDLQHGSGAGLWVVAQIVDFCDATIDFSVDEAGTTAHLLLPA